MMPKLVVGMCPAMTTQVLKQLQSKGIEDVLEFISTDPEKITSSCGLSYKKVMLIRRVLLAQYSAFPINGLTLYKEALSSCSVLPSGCSNLDAILDGGIYTGEIIEIVGTSVSGKTQFCQSLAVNVAAVLEKNVACIDTTVGWSVNRMAEILTSRHPDAGNLFPLSRIKLSQCLTIEELNSVLTQIRDALQNQQDLFFSSLKLIIIDSVAPILSPCFFSGTYVEGLSLFQEFGRQLNAIAKDFNIALLVTNNMVSSNASGSSDAFVVKPALGKCWTFVPSIRLIFQPQSEPCSYAPEVECKNISVLVSLDKSTRSGKRTTAFTITKSGVANV